jgi:hypothetical protein
VEYNGIQHYKYPNYFHNSYTKFMAQVQRDQTKKEICEREGVYLISVPYNIPYQRIPEFIIGHLPEVIQNRVRREDILQGLTDI